MNIHLNLNDLQQAAKDYIRKNFGITFTSSDVRMTDTSLTFNNISMIPTNPTNPTSPTGGVSPKPTGGGSIGIGS